MANQATRTLDEQVLPSPAKDQRQKETQQGQVSPRAGRTGGAGARAERPSEGGKRKPSDQLGRGAKAPSAAEGSDAGADNRA
jgi:hypothetical protein